MKEDCQRLAFSDRFSFIDCDGKFGMRFLSIVFAVLLKMSNQAHEQCFNANSVKTEIVTEVVV